MKSFVIGYYGDDGIGANHNVTVGRKIRRGFFYDRKNISDNRSMFGRMESFEKGEAFFSYSCKDRYVSYPLFCGKYLFGMLVCGADGRLFEIGEFLTFQLSRAIYMNWVRTP